jgi:hypothetical protein
MNFLSSNCQWYLSVLVAFSSHDFSLLSFIGIYRKRLTIALILNGSTEAHMSESNKQDLPITAKQIFIT